MIKRLLYLLVAILIYMATGMSQTLAESPRTRCVSSDVKQTPYPGCIVPIKAERTVAVLMKRSAPHKYHSAEWWDCRNADRYKGDCVKLPPEIMPGFMPVEDFVCAYSNDAPQFWCVYDVRRNDER